MRRIKEMRSEKISFDKLMDKLSNLDSRITVVMFESEFLNHQEDIIQQNSMEVDISAEEISFTTKNQSYWTLNENIIDEVMEDADGYYIFLGNNMTVSIMKG